MTEISFILDLPVISNLKSVSFFEVLKKRHPTDTFKVTPTELRASGVTGNSVTLLETATLPVRLSQAKKSLIIWAEFLIARDFKLPADGIIGIATMRTANITLNASKEIITQYKRNYPVMDAARPILVASFSMTGTYTGIRGLSVRSIGQRKESTTATPPADSIDTLTACGPEWSVRPAVLTILARFLRDNASMCI